MHSLNVGAWARLAPVVLLAVAAGGCKAKVDRSGADSGARDTGENPHQARRVVLDYLARGLSHTSLPGGETLIALDRVMQVRVTSKTPDSAVAEGRARVFVRTTAGEDIQRNEPLSCRLGRKPERWVVRSCRIGGSPVAARVTAPPENGDAGGDLSVGVPECDRFIRFLRCYASKMPKPSRAAMQRSFRRMLQSYRKMAQNPSTRACLVTACSKGLKAMRESMVKLPRFKDCASAL